MTILWDGHDGKGLTGHMGDWYVAIAAEPEGYYTIVATRKKQLSGWSGNTKVVVSITANTTTKSLKKARLQASDMLGALAGSELQRTVLG